jgi:hypothetical protein
MSSTATRPPSRANASDIASPSPEPPPVTTTTLSANLCPRLSITCTSSCGNGVSQASPLGHLTPGRGLAVDEGRGDRSPMSNKDNQISADLPDLLLVRWMLTAVLTRRAGPGGISRTTRPFVSPQPLIRIPEYDGAEP